ncbi:MAG: hypothetical protein ACUVTL_09315 [Thermoproteota archaeon]
MQTILAEELDRCKSFGDIFEVVKKSVFQTIGRQRAGLSLYLTELPPNIGAFHQVGSNSIVMNKALLEVVEKSPRSRREKNSFIYSILLHEYLHSLGYIDELKTRRITQQVAAQSFGDYHVSTKMCSPQGPWAFFPEALSMRSGFTGEFEIIRDFDRTPNSYLA